MASLVNETGWSYDCGPAGCDVYPTLDVAYAPDGGTWIDGEPLIPIVNSNGFPSKDRVALVQFDHLSSAIENFEDQAGDK